MNNDSNAAISESGASTAHEIGDPQFVINGLAQLLDDTWLVALVPLSTDATVGRVYSEWVSSAAPQEISADVVKLVTERLATKGALGFVESRRSAGWSVWAEPVRIGPGPVRRRARGGPPDQAPTGSTGRSRTSGSSRPCAVHLGQGLRRVPGQPRRAGRLGRPTG